MLRKTITSVLCVLVALSAVGVFYVNREPFFELWKDSPAAGWFQKKTDPPVSDPATSLTVRLAETIKRPERPQLPERYRVALVNFQLEHDTWVGQQNVKRLAGTLEVVLAHDDSFVWLDRQEVAAAAGELATRVQADDTNALALGSWLDCQLLVSGTFRDIGLPTQYLALRIVEVETGARVVSQRVPITVDISQPDALERLELETLHRPILEALHAARSKLIATKDAARVTLLFFRNATQQDRLDEVEFRLPEMLESLAEHEPGLRLIRLTDPADALDEQSFALLGLSDRDPLAWVKTSDYYLWGFAEEQAVTAGPTAAEDVPVLVTLFLWNGRDKPLAFERAATWAGMDEAVRVVASEAWEAARQPVPDRVSIASRDAVVALLTGQRIPEAFRPEGVTIPHRSGWNTNTANDPRTARRHATRLLETQAAWFFDPENSAHGRTLVTFNSKRELPNRGLIALQNRRSDLDRFVRRHGYNFSDTDTLAGGAALLDKHLKWINDSAKLITRTRGQRQLPPDTPNSVRQEMLEALADEMISLGETTANGYVQHLAAKRRSQSRLPFYLESCLKQSLTDDPIKRLSIWDAWWPTLEAVWHEEREESPSSRWEFNDNLLSLAREVHADADRLDLYGSRFAEPADEAGSDYTAPILTAEQYRKLHAWVDQAAASGDIVLPRPSLQKKDPSVSPEEMRERRDERYAAEAQRLRDPSMPPELRLKLRRSFTLREARFGPNSITTELIPRHADAPLVDLNAIPRIKVALPEAGHPLQRAKARPTVPDLPWIFPIEEGYLLTWQGSEEPDLRAGYAATGQFYPLRLMLRFDPWRLTSTTLETFDQAEFYRRLHQGRQAELKPQLAAVVVDRWLWRVADEKGLRGHSLDDPDLTRTLTTQDGLISDDLVRVARAGNDLWVLTKDGRLGVVGEINSDAPRFVDMPGKMRWGSDTLSGNSRRAIVRQGRDWFWVDRESGETIEIEAWLDQQSDRPPDDPVVEVRGTEDGMVVISARQTYFLSEDGQSDWSWTNRYPPMPGAIVAQDETCVWVAYSWQAPVEARPQPRDAFGRRNPEEPAVESRTRVVALHRENGQPIGQFEVRGQAKALHIRGGELHLFAPDASDDLYILNRDALLSLMGQETQSNTPPAIFASSMPLPHRAALAGDLEALQKLKELPDALDRPEPRTGWRPLHAAIRGGHTETVRWLLTQDANPSLPSRVGTYAGPLSLAAFTNHPDVIKALRAAGATPAPDRAEALTPLHAAAMADSVSAIIALRNLGADFNRYASMAGTPLRTWTFSRYMPFHIALLRQHEDSLDALLELAESPPRGPMDHRNNHLPITRVALYEGREDVALALLDAGYPPNFTDPRGLSLFDDAYNFGSPELPERLLDAGVKPHHPRQLDDAIASGNLTLISRLVDAGLDPIAFLSDPDPDSDRVLNDHDMPLLSAAGRTDLSAYHMLREATDIDLDRLYGQFRIGDLLASTLAETRHLQEAIDLAEAGYRLDLTGIGKRTVLHQAARIGKQQPLIPMWLALGLNPHQINSSGETPLDVAQGDHAKALLRDPETTIQNFLESLDSLSIPRDVSQP